ncbi:MAG: hypothetical protein H6709_21525, partial [Kofleriaceae bacterium]|nr:hypothetical protein [Kofleriaceae bacterium]
RPAAIATPTGRRDVVMPAEVLGGDAGGVLAVLATLADASLHRQGLARTRVGAAVVEGADVAPEPLTVRCDGTQRLGLGSAPLGDHGEPVRRFTIVDGGVLRGLALDEREAALRGEPPNGGVRNLTIGGGASTPEALRAPGALELLEVTHVDVEPLTGQVAIGIGLATLHGDAGATTTVSGGELQGDLVAALCRSRRTAGTSRDGGYIGPGLIGLPGLIVV